MNTVLPADLLTGLVGIVMMPWKLVADPDGYIFTWLIGYSALLGPVLPPGFIPLGVASPLPARLEPDGTLRIQVRPGRWQARITEVLSREIMLPAVGQGALGIEIRAAEEAAVHS